MCRGGETLHSKYGGWDGGKVQSFDSGFRQASKYLIRVGLPYMVYPIMGTVGQCRNAAAMSPTQLAAPVGRSCHFEDYCKMVDGRLSLAFGSILIARDVTCDFFCAVELSVAAVQPDEIVQILYLSQLQALSAEALRTEF